MNKTSSKPHLTLPVDSKRTQTSSKKVRKTELPSDHLRNESRRNECQAISISDSESKRNILLDSLKDLNSRILEDSDLVFSLREKLQALLSGKQKPEPKQKYQEEEEKNDENTQSIVDGLTNQNMSDFLSNNPVILEDFFNKTSSFIHFAKRIPDNLYHNFIELSLEQINSLSLCIDYFNNLKQYIKSTSFISRAHNYGKFITGSKEAAILSYDKKSDEFFTYVSNVKHYFPLIQGRSFASQALYNQETFIIEAPADSDLFFPQLDQLLNPGNRPLMAVPIGKIGVFYVCQSNVFRSGFSKSESYIFRFFSDLLSPILEDHLRYMDMIYSVENRRYLQIFKTNLISKTKFQTLIPFLYETFNECLAANDVENFLYLEGEFKEIRNGENNKIIEKKYPCSGIPSIVVKNRSMINFQRVTEKIDAYDELIDKWTLNTCFAGFPVKNSNDEIIAVICLSGKTNSNKFTKWDIEFMEIVCRSLALIIPICIENMDSGKIQNRLDNSSLFPKMISSYDYKILKNPDSFAKIGNDIANVLKCENVGIFQKVNQETKTLYLTNNTNFLGEEFLKNVTNPGTTITTDNLSEIHKFEPLPEIEYKNISIVSRQYNNIDISICALNSSIFKKDDKSNRDVNVTNHLSVFLNILHIGLVLQNFQNSGSIMETKSIAIKNAFDTTNTAFMNENPLIQLLTHFTDLLRMEEFCVYEKRSVTNIFVPYIGSNGVNMSFSIPFDDILAQKILLNDVPDLIQNFSESNMGDSVIKSQFKGFNTLLYLPIMNHSTYLVIFTGDIIVSNYKMIIDPFSPIIRMLLLNYIDNDNHRYIFALNQIDIAKSAILDVEITSRLFNVETYQENDKIIIITKMFQALGALNAMGIDDETFLIFLLEARKHYKNLPYHNWNHAIDTVQFIYSTVTRGKLQRIFNSKQMAAMLIAALLHDIGHEGLSNEYYQKTHSYIFVVYGNQSCFERYQIFKIFKLLKKQTWFNQIDCQDFWNMLNSLILATDVSQYPIITERFVNAMKSFNPKDLQHRIIFGEYIILCANLSNISRTFQQTKSAVDNLLEELRIQNELEKTEQVPLSRFYSDSNMESIKGIEVDFIENVAIPLYRNLSKSIPEIGEYVIQIEDNKKKWYVLRE